MQPSTPKQASGPGLCCAMRSWLVAPLSVLAASALMSAPAVGQEVSAALAEEIDQNARGEGEALCVVFSQEDERDDLQSAVASQTPKGGLKTVYASCRGQIHILGRGNDFRVSTHKESGAVSVVISRRGRDRVWLLSTTAEREILREELTGTLARMVGRGGMSDLRDVQIDLAGFELSGTLQLAPSQRPNARASKAAIMDLKDRLLPEGNTTNEPRADSAESGGL